MNFGATIKKSVELIFLVCYNQNAIMHNVHRLCMVQNIIGKLFGNATSSLRISCQRSIETLYVVYFDFIACNIIFHLPLFYLFRR
jgi:hypothetical protein